MHPHEFKETLRTSGRRREKGENKTLISRLGRVGRKEKENRGIGDKQEL